MEILFLTFGLMIFAGFIQLLGVALTILQYTPLILSIIALLVHLFVKGGKPWLYDLSACVSLIWIWFWFSDVPEKDMQSYIILVAVCMAILLLTILLFTFADKLDSSLTYFVISIPLLALLLYGGVITIGRDLADPSREEQTGKNLSYLIEADGVPVRNKDGDTIVTLSKGDIITAYPPWDQGKYLAVSRSKYSAAGEIYGVKLEDGTKGLLYSYLNEKRVVTVYEKQKYLEATYGWCPKPIQSFFKNVYQNYNFLK